MPKKSPKYHSTKLIVNKLKAVSERIKATTNDPQLLAMIEDVRANVIDFDNDMWKQTEEMSEYLPV